MDARVHDIMTAMASRIGSASGLGGSLKFDFGDRGSIFIDGTSEPGAVRDGLGETADCTISLSLETFEKLIAKQLDPTSAFMQGKLRVAGDMGIALKLSPLLAKI